MSPQTAGLDMCNVTIIAFFHNFSVFPCTTFITFIRRSRRFHSGENSLTDSVCSQKVEFLCLEKLLLSSIWLIIILWYDIGLVGRK